MFRMDEGSVAFWKCCLIVLIITNAVSYGIPYFLGDAWVVDYAQSFEAFIVVVDAWCAVSLYRCADNARFRLGKLLGKGLGLGMCSFACYHICHICIDVPFGIAIGLVLVLSFLSWFFLHVIFETH